jgi:hypothetical protein
MKVHFVNKTESVVDTGIGVLPGAAASNIALAQ